MSSELHDSKGFPIWPGDLVRTYHFTGRRGKIHYLYHVATMRPDGLYLRPAELADPNRRDEGGSFYPNQGDLDAFSATILLGDGPTPGSGFESREKRKAYTISPTALLQEGNE